MKTALPLLVLGLAPGLFAQHFDPRPDGALVRLAFDGPARMAAAFAGTNFHDLLTSKQFTEAYAPVTQAIEQGLDAMKAETPFDPHAAYAAMLRYGGRVEVTLGVEANGQNEPTVWSAISLGADGTTDLAAFCAEVEKLALDSKAPLTDRSVGDQKWLAQDLPTGFVTLPRMVGDRAVILITSADEAALAGFFPRTAPPERKAGAPISLSLDCRRTLDLIGEILDARSGLGDTMHAIVDALGFANVADVDIDIDRLERFLDMRMTLTSKGPRRGFLAMVMPNGAKLPAIGALVQQSPNWSVAPVDFAPLLPLIGLVMEAIPEATKDLAQMEAAFVEGVGVRLREDLLAHLGGTVLMATDAAPDADSEFGAMTTMCLGLELRDGAAFGRSVETVLERAGVLEMRKSERYRDTDVHRVTLPGIGIKVYWAITDRLFLVAAGDGGRARLGSILDASAAAARGETPPALRKEVLERLQVVPAHYAGLGVQRFGTLMFDAALAGIREGVATGDLDFDIDTVTEIVDALREMCSKHALDLTVNVTYLDPERAVTRTIW